MTFTSFIQRKDGGMRKSLFQARDELDIARTAEKKKANEKLSQTRLQASICKQAIIASKSVGNGGAQTLKKCGKPTKAGVLL